MAISKRPYKYKINVNSADNSVTKSMNRRMQRISAQPNPKAKTPTRYSKKPKAVRIISSNRIIKNGPRKPRGALDLPGLFMA